MVKSLPEQTYEKLLQLIVSEDYQPGDRLPSENDLSERFNVSRNTLRTALKKLSVIGFTETRRGGGTFVKKIGGDAYLNFFLPSLLMDSHYLIDIMEFRKGIEVQAVKLAAERATEEDIQELQAIYDESQKYLNDMEMFAMYNTGFHARIAKASHNQMFEKIMEIVRNIIATKMQDFQIEQGSDIDSNFYHFMILQCIINHKPDEAAFFMDKHTTLLVDRVRGFSEREEYLHHEPDGA